MEQVMRKAFIAINREVRGGKMDINKTISTKKHLSIDFDPHTGDRIEIATGISIRVATATYHMVNGEVAVQATMPKAEFESLEAMLTSDTLKDWELRQI